MNFPAGLLYLLLNKYIIACMKNISITYARSAEGALVHVSEAVKEQAYFCTECGDRLSLRISRLQPGEKGYQKSHFVHRRGSGCSSETIARNQFRRKAAELLARKIEEKSAFPVVWKCRVCNKTHRLNLLEGVAAVETECRIGEWRPDVALLGPDGKIKAAVGIAVREKPDSQAVQYYETNGILYLQFYLQSAEDLDRPEERLSQPSPDSGCPSPVCEVCGERKNTAYLRIVDTACYKCGRPTKAAMLVDGAINDEVYVILGLEDFTPEMIRLAEKHGVIIQERYSRTREESYLASVCPDASCAGFVGEHYLREYVWEDYPYTGIELGPVCFNCIEKAKWLKEEQEAEEERKQEERMIAMMGEACKPCPECGGILEIQSRGYGGTPYLRCCNYPDCTYEEEFDMAES